MVAEQVKRRVIESEWKSPSSIDIKAKKDKRLKRQKECGKDV